MQEMLNIVDPQENLLGQVLETLAELSFPVLQTQITHQSAFKNVSSEGKKVYDKTGKDYQACVDMFDR